MALRFNGAATRGKSCSSTSANPSSVGEVARQPQPLTGPRFDTILTHEASVVTARAALPRSGVRAAGPRARDTERRRTGGPCPDRSSRGAPAPPRALSQAISVRNVANRSC